MLTPNKPSHVHDNDSDASNDFAIISTPSPQNSIGAISNNKHAEATDDFEHLLMPHLSDSSNSDVIGTPSDDLNVFNPCKQNVKPLRIILPNQIDNKSNVLPIDPPPKSNSSSPKGTMEDIIHLTEPLNSSQSIIDNVSSISVLSIDAVVDSLQITSLDQENEQLIKKKVTAVTTQRSKYRRYEYEHFILEKSSKKGCDGFLCCKRQHNQNMDGMRMFIENAASVADAFSRYMDKCMDKCFGGVPGNQINETTFDIK